MAKKIATRTFNFSIATGRRVTDAYAKVKFVDTVVIPQADLDLAEVSEEDIAASTKTYLRASKFFAQVTGVASAKRSKAAAEKRAAKKAAVKKVAKKAAVKKVAKKATVKKVVKKTASK